MTLKEIVQAVMSLIHQAFDEIWPENTSVNMKEIRNYLIIGLVIGGGFAGYYGYRAYKRSKNEAAFGFLADYVQEYEKDREDRKIDWADVEQSFNLEREQHLHSAAAPYLLMYKAELLVKQGKKEEALGVMREALAQMPTDSPLRSLYQTKQALMQLDIGDGATRDSALTLLRELANDEHNSQRDCAGYYLGQYYWITGDIDQAKEVWLHLIEDQKKAHAAMDVPEAYRSMGKSPWADRAQEQLAQIT